LAGGLLTGKYNQGIPEGTRATLEGYDWLRSRFESEESLQRIAKVGQLMNIADELGASMAQLALAWILKNPNISTAITGASKTEQIIDNLQALDLVAQLSDDVMENIEQILENKPAEPQSFR
jgi:aryl-alcohol dehydrogenase-like predicted oxidoreductase